MCQVQEPTTPDLLPSVAHLSGKWVLLEETRKRDQSRLGLECMTHAESSKDQNGDSAADRDMEREIVICQALELMKFDLRFQTLHPT